MTRTLLLVTPDLVARADFNSRGKLLSSAQSVPPPGTRDIGSLTLAALILVKQPPRRVWVLTTSAATATVEIPEGRLSGMSREEVASALAFEAESLTGVQAISSQASAQRLGSAAGSDVWWLTQAPHALRREFEAEITRRGGKVEGLAHPGGLAHLLRDPASPPTADFELWGDLLFLHRDPSSGVPLEILPVNETATPSTLLARYATGSRAAGTTLLSPKTLPGSPDTTILSLQDPQTLAAWFGVWEAALREDSSAVPVLIPARSGLSGGRRRSISMATAAAAIALCYGHWWLTDTQLKSGKAELASLTAVLAQRDDLQKTAAEVAKLRGDLDAAKRTRSQAMKGFGALLDAIAGLRPAGLLVQSMSDKAPTGDPRLAGMNATISGVCTDEKLANSFARDLGARLAASGWSVSPARTSAAIIADTTVWRFDIPVQLGGAPSLSKR